MAGRGAELRWHGVADHRFNPVEHLRPHRNVFLPLDHDQRAGASGRVTCPPDCRGHVAGGRSLAQRTDRSLCRDRRRDRRRPAPDQDQCRGVLCRSGVHLAGAQRTLRCTHPRPHLAGRAGLHGTALSLDAVPVRCALGATLCPALHRIGARTSSDRPHGRAALGHNAHLGALGRRDPAVRRIDLHRSDRPGYEPVRPAGWGPARSAQAPRGLFLRDELANGQRCAGLD